MIKIKLLILLSVVIVLLVSPGITAVENVKGGNEGQGDGAVIDTIKPVITNPLPSHTVVATNIKPTISATVQDDLSGLAQVELRVNWRVVKKLMFNGDTTEKTIVWAPEVDFTDALIFCEVSAKDKAGNIEKYKWTVRIPSWSYLPWPDFGNMNPHVWDVHTVYEGQQLSFTWDQLKDNDTYYSAGGSIEGQNEEDKIINIIWNANPNVGIFEPQNTTVDGSITASTLLWTAPENVPGLEGWVVITATLVDEHAVIAGDLGSRNDPDNWVTRVWTCKVIDGKIWQPGAAITADISTKKEYTGVVNITKGGYAIMLSVKGTDMDSWTRTTCQPTQGSEVEENLQYQWSATGGYFSDPYPDNTIPADQEPMLYWHSPNTSGTYIISVQIDDTGTIIAPDVGNRDDNPIVKTITIEVVETPSISSIDLSQRYPVASGVTQLSNLEITANICDPNDIVQSVTFSAFGQQYQGTIDENGRGHCTVAIPINTTHEEYIINATINWDGGSYNVNRKTLVFFSLFGYDEEVNTDRSITWDKNTNTIVPFDSPNWFSTRAGHWGNFVPNLNANDVYFNNDLQSSGLFDFTNMYKLGNDKIYISNQAAQTLFSGPPPYVYSPKTSGIDSVGATIVHERRHKELTLQSWNGRGGFKRELDQDYDFFNDDWEDDVWNQTNPDPYFKNKEYDGMSIDTDNEFMANMAARSWTIGSLDSDDYANPGKQTE